MATQRVVDIKSVLTTYSSSKFPLEIGENVWLKTSDSQYFAPTLDRDHTCDWPVIGSGFAGISAAKRLTELRSGDKIILIDAIGICLLYTSPSPRDPKSSRMPSSA